MEDPVVTAGEPQSAGTPAPPAPSEPAPIEHPFEFHGDAREYFRIWIVNLALGIVTLGLYSAWAKVRSERYFYGNTRLAGVPFEYLAQPWPILKGRLIAVALFGGYVLAGQFSVTLQLGLAALIAVLMPWLLVRGAAFRARYSSWRGLRFRFVTDYRQAYVRYLLLWAPLALTLGLLFPYVKFKQKQFFVERHRYGGSAFGFRATGGDFYPPYLAAWGALVAWAFVSSMLIGAFVFGVVLHGRVPTPPPAWFGYAFALPMYLGYFAVWAFLSAALANLLYNRAELGPHRFRSSLKGSRLFGLYLGNTLAIVCSAGLAIPWAKVRLARYRAQSLTLLAGDDPANLHAEAGEDIDAVAAEMDGLFDIDIGL
ncbi:YjgN family protein [Dokdonella ginsengisoli]|uniref:YjgN family protein n=1 Tax=Dokdonella ginsengisoli TaxID=363846 RepID=A0ABV9QY50_9GAMM